MTPEKITDNVKKLFAKIASNSEPIYIKSTPIPDAPINECIPIVEERIENAGGEMILGWQIWEGNLLVEAEFHAVWKSPTGELYDISPKAIEVNKILFLPDNRLRYEGKQINNIRMNITQNTLVDDFIEICDTIFEIENKGERAFMYELELSGKEVDDYEKLQEMKNVTQAMASKGLSRNSPCFCGSQNKYKHCHGKEIKKIIKKYKKA